jgi:hypothetical protein
MAALTNYTGGGKAATNFIIALTVLQQAAPAVSDAGVPFLKMNSDDGTWTYGQEGIEVTKGSLWAAVVSTFATGFISWKGGKPEAEAMASLGDIPINPQDLPPVTSLKGWEEQMGVAFVCVDSDSNNEIGRAVIYKQNSKGGIEHIKNLLSLVIKNAQAKMDCVPLVTFEHTTYTHKEHGLVVKPAFPIAEWMSLDELASEYGKDTEGVSLAAKRLPPAAAPAAAPKVAAPAEPTRARRGAAQAPAPDVVDIDPATGDVAAGEPPRRRRSTVVDEIRAAAADDNPDEPPFETDVPAAEPSRRRRRT